MHRIRPDVAYTDFFRLAHWPLFRPLLVDANQLHSSDANSDARDRNTSILAGRAPERTTTAAGQSRGQASGDKAVDSRAEHSEHGEQDEHGGHSEHGNGLGKEPLVAPSDWILFIRRVGL